MQWPVPVGGSRPDSNWNREPEHTCRRQAPHTDSRIKAFLIGDNSGCDQVGLVISKGAATEGVAMSSQGAEISS